MQTRGLLTAALGGVFAIATPAHATILLDVVNPPGASDTAYFLDFRATAATTTLWVEGYQLVGEEDVSSNKVATGGGPNLLGALWSFAPAASGSDAFTVSALPAPDLVFKGSVIGGYDAFSQSFATTPGVLYTYSFLFSNSAPPEAAPSGILVATSAAAAVPEPSIWVMALVGFASLAFAYRGRTTVAI